MLLHNTFPRKCRSFEKNITLDIILLNILSAQITMVYNDMELNRAYLLGKLTRPSDRAPARALVCNYKARVFSPAEAIQNLQLLFS